MKKVILMCAAALTAVFVSAADPAFLTAKPVWPTGLTREMNTCIAFSAAFDATEGTDAFLRVTGSSVYRITLNGKYIGYGPARAAHGFFRVDDWPFGTALKVGRNELLIEVAGYNVNSYYLLDQPAFLQAEVVANGHVIAATGVPGAFSAVPLPRVRKTPRYSFQRTFSEAYRMSPGVGPWPNGKPSVAALPLTVCPNVTLLPRLAPYPDFTVNASFKPLSRAAARFDPDRAVRGERFLIPSAHFKCFPLKELEVNSWYDVQRVVYSERKPETTVRDTYDLGANESLIFDGGVNGSGFPGLTVTCTTPIRVLLAFDEILSGNGEVNPVRYGCNNVVIWDLTAPGTYQMEAFEPYTFRYANVVVLGGGAKISAPTLRSYKNPEAQRASFVSSDADLNKIFAAARETFAQNAVDIFTDCPSRERAGWLCDSFFIGRVNALLCGNTVLERLFLQNYALPKKFDAIPAGALPMCYPSDHPNGEFIPNWTMWFVLELDEYFARSGDRVTVDALRPRLIALVDYLKTFRNTDGLLEKLPSWIFVEWSHANKLVRDVNYPSNMTWAEVLDCMNRLYNLPELSAEAKRVRETIRKQSRIGSWFCDNAVRQKDGTLKLSGQCTETCQYYAFYFKTATPERDPELWRKLVQDFGPQRKQTKKHPEIFPANAFVGNYLRLELLSRVGLGRQILSETKGYFKYMADRTGTLWENDDTHASCNHGFASHVAVLMIRDVLGVKAVDLVRKTVTLGKTDVDLDACSCDLPLGNESFSFSRKRGKDGKLERTVKLPEGWRVLESR